MTTVLPEKRSPKDYASDQELRWCPGCGDYAIIKGVQKVLADLNVDPDRTVFVSGIGCAARFPYYMETYGFHTIHGRAPAVATGVKLANPDLDVWVISGDGDALSIGGNHLLHLLRRNVNVQFLLFNNEIYGLTKGQYSPTSRVGTRSPSTPQGSVDHPVSACEFALGAGARFVARAVDIQTPKLVDVLKHAHAHRGTSFVEIFQNCVVFNDNVFGHFTDKEVAPDRQLFAEHGKPLRWGRTGEHGLRFNPQAMRLEVVEVGPGGVPEDQVAVHDRTNRTLAQMLVSLEPPEFPVVLGVIYDNPAPSSYEDDVHAQVTQAGAPTDDLAALLHGGQTWRVEG